MSQKHRKFMHFLREHFEFATDICPSDITSAAISLRFCVELLQCEFADMVSEADSDVRKEFQVLLYQSEELLSLLQHPAHFQYDFLERRYGGSISVAEFKDVRQRLFHLIKEYMRHIFFFNKCLEFIHNMLLSFNFFKGRRSIFFSPDC